jgi:hypothetical protein
MRLVTHYSAIAIAVLVVVCGDPKTAHAESYAVNFDPFDGMGNGDWEPGTLNVGSRLVNVNAVYAPEFGIEFGEHINNGGQGRLAECCDGNYFLNVGKAYDGELHWFVNAVSGKYFPAGTTISVSWNNNSGGPSALKAYADTIPNDEATIDNANDGSLFGGIVGEVVHGPEQYPTLELVLPADARSFTVHQSAIDFENDTSFITGQYMGEDAAPNASINGLTYELLTESVVGLSGDYNGDDVVDAADYTVWRDTLNSVSDLRADGDESGTIDGPDYDLWKANFGESANLGSAASSNAVPEPASYSPLLLLAMAVACSWRTRCTL